MKVLIWFLCAFIESAIITALEIFAGIHLGMIPVFILSLLTFAVARGLCGRWDNNHKMNKNVAKEANPESTSSDPGSKTTSLNMHRLDEGNFIERFKKARAMQSSSDDFEKREGRRMMKELKSENKELFIRLSTNGGVK